MHFATILKITAASTLLVAASAQGITYDGASGGNWNTASNWSTDTLPTLADNVVIPTGLQVVVNDAVSSTDALANSVDVQGTGQILITANALQVDGGANSTVAPADGIKLDGATATLYLSATQQFSGAGSILMDDTGALMDIASGATITFSLPVHGFGSISANSGTATMSNGSEVTADSASGALELASDLNLSGSGAWKAAGGELQFKRATGNNPLAGNVFSTGGGNLHFFESVTFTNGSACGSGGSTWNWSGSAGAPSYLTIAPGKTFGYKCFTSNCSNPDPGSSPFSVTAGVSEYSTSCSS